MPPQTFARVSNQAFRKGPGNPGNHAAWTIVISCYSAHTTKVKILNPLPKSRSKIAERPLADS